MEDGDADDERRGPEEPLLPSDDPDKSDVHPEERGYGPNRRADGDDGASGSATDGGMGPAREPAGGHETTSGSHAQPTDESASLFDRDPDSVTAATPADVPTDWGTPQPSSEGHGTPSSGPAHDPGGHADEEVYEGAPDDEEMPLADHVEEMAMRLFVVVGVMAVVAVLALPYVDELINFLWYSFHRGTVAQAAEVCGTPDVGPAGVQRGVSAGVNVEAFPGVNCAYVYHPLALVLARLKAASLVGLIVAVPVFVYETYLFMRPGLYPRERRYYLAAVPTSLVLAAIGVGFAYFAILPAMFDYFITYSERATDLAFGLSHTFNIIVLMLGLFALIFQIPLFVMLAIMMGITTRKWLKDRRLYFWGAFAAIAFLFSPDPTGMAPLMVAVTMIALFEGTLLLLRWTGSNSPVPTADELAARRPVVWLLAGVVGYLLSPAPVPTGYYEQLPAAVTETLASVGLGNATPMLVGGGVIVLFELLAYLNKNYYGSVKLWRGLRKARLPVWAVAIVGGYLGSPDPTLFRLVNQVSLEATAAAAVTGALVVLFEAGLLVAKRRS